MVGSDVSAHGLRLLEPLLDSLMMVHHLLEHTA